MTGTAVIAVEEVKPGMTAVFRDKVYRVSAVTNGFTYLFNLSEKTRTADKFIEVKLDVRGRPYVD